MEFLLARLPADTLEVLTVIYGLDGYLPRSSDAATKELGCRRRTIAERLRDASLVCRNGGLNVMLAYAR